MSSAQIEYVNAIYTDKLREAEHYHLTKKARTGRRIIHRETIMKNKQLPVHIIFTVIYFSLALITTIPTGTASKGSLLGYTALCSFTPISTFILLALAGLHLYLHNRKALVIRTK
jgi:hypothetical protein